MSSEPIQVYIRFRPLNRKEILENDSPMWHLTKNAVSVRRESIQDLIEEKKVSSSFDPSFNYNHVFSWEDENQKVYETVAQKVVLSTLDGFNATIFAYGQTGSGKTFTMIGSTDTGPLITQKPSIRLLKSPSKPKSPTMRQRSSSAFGYKIEKVKKVPSHSNGIVPMALTDIFQVCSSYKNKHFFFKCSMMEIYNEHVYDLLKDTEDLNNEILTVGETHDKEFYIKGLSETVVNSIEEVLDKLSKGEQNRHYAATNLNHHSSRSHTIFRLSIRSLQVLPKKDAETEQDHEDSFENITTESVLNFVDLAGSERTSTVQALDDKTSKSQVFSMKSEQERVVSESKNINTSLFYLCQVINKLSELKMGIGKNDSHIPYRNSKLTKILKSSLGGNSRTCIICTATPSSSQFEQTLSTLRFGNSARTLTNNVKPNIKRETNSQLLLAYQQDIETLKKELETAKDNGWNFYNANTQAKLVLENKINKLACLLSKLSAAEPIRIGQDQESKSTVVSFEVSGDLVFNNPSINLFDFQVLSESKLKFDDSGLLAQCRLINMKTENKKLIEKIDSSNKALNVLKTNKSTLVGELERLSNLYEKIQQGVGEIKENIFSNVKIVESMEQKLFLYENGSGIQNFDDSELKNLEKLFLDRLETLNRCKMKKKLLNHLESLEGEYPSKVFEEIINKYNINT